MDGPPYTSDNATAANQILDDLLAEISDKLHAGESVDLEDYARRYPECAQPLRQMLPAMQALADLGLSAIRETSAAPRPDGGDAVSGCLGDFRILREIGRGGMGVVYEAEQVSLRRRVALKVLPFAALLDRRQLQRFQNEAQAAAALEHPNVVNILSVGCERGIHYYAMQFIEGQTLAQVIEELRQHAGPRAAADEPQQVSQLTQDQVAGRLGKGSPKPASDDPMVEPGSAPPTAAPAADTKREPQAAVSTQAPHRTSEFFRSVAQLGIQAAEALEHAHQMGVVHRDIKPSNLMVDDRGHLWVTDFGLAHIEASSPLGGEGRGEGGSLTMTGDVMGTLRYMSPEQSLGKPKVMDHRTDIYSLGVTLYELLTLQPAFAGEDRRSVLRQIADEEPRPPRRLNRAMPADLETIVLKAVSKSPAERYATAQELADDLRRYLEDKPIRAKHPGVVHRLRKWLRRHKGFVWAGAVILVLLALGSAFGTLMVARERNEALAAAARERNAAAEATAQRELAEANLDLALKALDAVYLKAIGEEKLLRQTAAHSGGTGFAPETRQPLSDLERELLKRGLGFYDQFARQNAASPRAPLQTARAYHRVGLLQAGLGDRQSAEAAFRAAIARFDSLTKQEPNNRDTYRQLAEAYTGLASVLTEWPAKKAALEKARTALGSALALGPNNHRLYLQRGDVSDQLRDFQKAVPDYDKALELGADDPNALRNSSGLSIWAFGPTIGRHIAQRLAARAFELAPDDPHSHLALAIALGAPVGPLIMSAENRHTVAYGMPDPAPALKHFARAIELAPKLSAAFNGRADFYYHLGDFEKALSDANRALELNPNNTWPLMVRAKVYEAQGKYEDALAALAQLPREPIDWGVLCETGQVHMLMGHYQDAVKSFTAALENSPGIWSTHKQRAECFVRLGDYERALADLKASLEINPNDPTALWWIPPGQLAQCPDSFRKGLLELADKAIEKSKGAAGCYRARARLYGGLGQTEKARADFDKYIQLQPDNAEGNNEIAWFLATYPDVKLRDPAKALSLAEKAVAAKPNAWEYLNTLGVVYYRLGQHPKTIETLQKAIQADKSGGTAFDFFFLAMARWQLGDKDEAPKWYQKGVEWIQQKKPGGVWHEELRRFRAEAEELLGTTKEPPAGKEKPQAK